MILSIGKGANEFAAAIATAVALAACVEKAEQPAGAKELDGYFDKLAAAHNASDGSYILSTGIEHENKGQTTIKGSARGLIPGICAAVTETLKRSSDYEAMVFWNNIRAQFENDEERRFREKRRNRA